MRTNALVRQVARLALLVLVAGFGLDAYADDPAGGTEEGEKKWKLRGEIRTRFEYLENFLDGQDSDESGDINDDEFSFAPYRVRVGAEGELPRDVHALVELQSFGTLGNEDPVKSLLFPPDQAGELEDLEDVNVQQAWVELRRIGGSGSSLRIGRQEDPYGTELWKGDNDFGNGISFDGARWWWTSRRGKDTIGAFYYKIDEDNVDPFFEFGGSEDANFFGATADFKLPEDRGTVGGYVFDLQLLSDFPSTKIYTIGGHYRREPSRDHAWDWNAELAIQTGDLEGGAPTGLDVSSSLFEGWIGFNWGEGVRQRVHLGAFFASGDDDPFDEDFEAAIPLFGDGHAWNRLGDTDFFGTNFTETFIFGLFSEDGTITGITDISVGYKAKAASGRHKFLGALHQFMATEDFVAITGLGPVAEDDLGLELDLRYGYEYSENVAIEVGVANLALGDAFDLIVSSGDADDVLRAWGQLRLRF